MNIFTENRPANVSFIALCESQGRLHFKVEQLNYFVHKRTSKRRLFEYIYRKSRMSAGYQMYDQQDVENSQVIGYNAEISTAQDYYPFGMLMPGRYTSDTQRHCVTINSTVLVSKPINIRATAAGVRAQAYRYGGSPEPPPVYQLAKAEDFAHEPIHFFHYNPAEEHDGEKIVTTDNDDDYVAYNFWLGGEPSGVTAYLQLHMDTSQQEQSFGFTTQLMGDLANLDMRVRQYYEANNDEYYELTDWRPLRTAGEQQFTIPVEREAVLNGGNTVLELRFTTNNGANFKQWVRIGCLRHGPPAPRSCPKTGW